MLQKFVLLYNVFCCGGGILPNTIIDLLVPTGDIGLLSNHHLARVLQISQSLNRRSTLGLRLQAHAHIGLVLFQISLVAGAPHKARKYLLQGVRLPNKHSFHTGHIASLHLLDAVLNL